jgi:hypothetical protein
MSSETEQIAKRELSCDLEGASASREPAANLNDVLSIVEKLDPGDRLRLISLIWDSLPPGHYAAPKASERAELRQLLDDDAGRTGHFPWSVVQTLIAGTKTSTVPKVYAVPRRFDLATIFVVTLAYSLLFGLMKGISVPTVASVVIAAFISIVGVGQAFLFGGKQPRTASLIAGVLVYLSFMIAAWLMNGPRMYPVSFMLIVVSYSIIGGAILGYLAGAIVGGVFLVADAVRKRLVRKPDVTD